MDQFEWQIQGPHHNSFFSPFFDPKSFTKDQHIASTAAIHGDLEQTKREQSDLVINPLKLS